jgi:hypothetical protein
MKPIIAFVVTLVVGLGAGTGVKVMTTKPAAPAHGDSTAAADSTAHGDSTAAAAAHVDTAVVASGNHVTPPIDTTPRAPVAHGDTAKHAPAATKTAAVPHAAADTVTERRLAKVFTSMDAKQAAKVLEHMADSDVNIILGYVGPRQAASIMSALPPERVAKLSKIALMGGAK